jgi:hypothetical protein
LEWLVTPILPKEKLLCGHHRATSTSVDAITEQSSQKKACMANTNRGTTSVSKTTGRCTGELNPRFVKWARRRNYLKKGLSRADVAALLTIGSQAGTQEEKEDGADDCVRAEQERKNICRARFYLAAASGAFFAKDEAAAEFVWKGLSPKEGQEALANVMAFSAVAIKSRVRDDPPWLGERKRALF